MRNTFYIIVCFFFLSISALSAQTKKVYATGNWEIANITPENARSKAIDEAKANALQKAGISELFTVINTGSVSDRLNYFVSSSSSELSGEIINYKIINEQILTEEKHIFYTVDIEATIRIKKNKRDLEFDAYIEGIRDTPYRDGDNISFSIRPTKVCYIHIFWFDETGKGNIVYPNKEEPSQMLKTNEHNFFPITQDYKIRKETQEPIENISVVFVLLKKDIPYTRDVTLEDLHQWILSIPPDLRILKFKNIFITQ
ncbi:DUF4384 domain-containing protein [uncultured Parabacteroides sp.]|uniref:DUF4384 domain-containing protein n=1 Tax=uncultured Parabacteroides sp. TaxID=512312 RepID=UPI0025F371AC|nr:DUF4384 domain-containing protein [uncultured Parabacteroides sp.]